MTERKGETKRQHYVPQCILRKFSRDEKNTSILVMKNGQLVPNGPLKNQCYEDYFYGEDQVMEKSFAVSEAELSEILGDLSSERLEDLSDDAITKIKLFVHYQLGRTRAAVEQLMGFIGATVKHVAAETARLNNEPVDEEALDRVKLTHPNGVGEAIWLTAKTTPLVRDLAVKFLSTSRDRGFVIGDHPVVAMNQFAEDHPKLSRLGNITAPVAKGLLLFLPLSSSLSVVLYDPKTYEFDVSRRVCNIGPRDVLLLNMAQAVNCMECVFFDSERLDDGMTSKLVEIKKGHRNVHKSEVRGGTMRKEDGKVRQIVETVRNDIRVGARFSFLRVTDRLSYDEYDAPFAPVRSWELVEMTEAYGELLERVVETRRQKEEQGASDTKLDEEEIWQAALAVTAGRRGW